MENRSTIKQYSSHLGHLKSRLLLMAFFLISICTSSQISQDSVLTRKALTSDIDSLESTLWKTHQNPLTYCNRKQLDDAFNKARKQVNDGASFNEFSKIIAQTLRVMRDSHSYLKFSSLLSNYKWDDGLFLNFTINTIDRNIYIQKDMEMLIPDGSQLVSINKVPINGLYNNVSKYSIMEGNSNVGLMRISDAIFHKVVVLNSDIETTNEIIIIPPGKEEKITIEYPGKLWPSLAKENKNRKKILKIETDKVYDLIINDSLSLAILKIQSFAQSSDRNYYKFLKKSFKKIHAQEIQTLAIDLRDNTGGKADRLAQIYSYTSKKGVIMPANIIAKQSTLSVDRYSKSYKGLTKFVFNHFYKKNERVQNYKGMVNMELNEVDTFYFSTPSEPNENHFFDGDLYLLINGKSGSASVNFAAGYKSNKMGVVVGEPCLGPMSGTWGNPVEYTLPNSKLKVYLSTIRFNTNNSFEYDPKSIQPDFHVKTTVEDFQNGVDTQIEFIKNRISTH